MTLRTAHRPLKIVADSMLALDDLSAHLPVEVVSIPGRQITADDVKNADALLIRSITEVDANLLAGSSVQFVGSATIGTDHVDIDVLNKKGIGFSSAPGCNANAVVDYVMASLLGHYGSEKLSTLCVGIAGYGNVGSRLYQCLLHFGIDCRVFDPFVKVPDANCAASLNEVLDCDAVSLHVPLTRGGVHPTFHLIDEQALQRRYLNSSANDKLLINSSRGAVVDNVALKRLLEEKPEVAVVLDVWENEPAIDTTLLNNLKGVTGHIAGYSLAGKQRGVLMVLESMADYFQLSSDFSAMRAELTGEALTASVLSAFDGLTDYAKVLRDVCSIEEESHMFRVHMQAYLSEPARGFDDYRRDYRLRREIDYLV